MFFPRGFPHPALPAAALALALLPLALNAGTASEEVSQSIRAGLPPYDPNPPKPAATPAPPPPATHVLKRVSDPGARIPLEVPKPAGAGPTEPAPKPITVRGVLELPKMTVSGRKEKLPSLPRLYVQPAARNVAEPTNPDWETPAARAARLIQKHITGFDQVLNSHPLPLIGGSLAAKAAQAEAREHAAKELNNIADLLELSLLTGTETPAEQKKLRGEYLDALAARPR